MSHQSIKYWNQWLTKYLGGLVLEAERELLQTFLSGKYGKHALLIGVPHQIDLLDSQDIPCHLLLTPLLYHKKNKINVIEITLNELPIASGSVDLVILPHTLELVDNPRQLLTEACRIVKPEGHLVICGFNPFSLWGLKKLVANKHDGTLPSMNFINYGIIKKWLSLADFELIKQSTLLYSPPMQNQQILKRLHFLEWIGRKCHMPWGGVYVLMARAKVIPLTPIRLRWKQSLAGMGIPTSIPGPTVRNAK